jgi:glycosyltransferase involved in cell wall biosynthesis
MRGMGGGERWVLEAASGLASRGHDVSIAGRSSGALVGEAARLGIPALGLPMSGDADVLSVVRLASWMRRREIGVVNVSIERAVRLGAAAAALSGRPAVIERRGLELPIVPSALDRLVYGRFVDHIIANAEAIRRGVVEAGLVPPERVSVIPNGIDPARVAGGDGVSFRREWGIDPAAPLVLFAGRLVSDKRPLDALTAFGSVLHGLPEAVLVVAGDGPLRAELSRRAREYGPSVVFTGRLGDIARALNAADVILVSSVREGMPHVVLEAMAAGTPVVATAVSGIPEIIENGSSGLLVPAGDVQGLATRVLEVLSRPGLRADLSRSARSAVLGRHSLTSMLDAVEERFIVEFERRGERRP